MKKNFVIDSTILQLSPYAIFAFDDNNVYLCQRVIEEMKELSKTGDSETRGNARQLGIILDDLFSTIAEGNAEEDNIGHKIPLENGGTLVYVPCHDLHMSSTDQIISLMFRLKGANKEGILVSRDPYLRTTIKSELFRAEDFKSDSLPMGSAGYDGRCVVYVPGKQFMEFAEKKVLDVEPGKSRYYYTKSTGNSLPADYKLSINEYVIVVNGDDPQSGPLLGRFDGKKIVSLYGYAPTCRTPVYGVLPRNVGQRFALDALLTPAEKAPLVILKGPAGTAKTFLSMAAALAQTVDNWEGGSRYRKILLTRPNTKMDDDIGYLKGDEVQKVMPALRGLTDNVDNLMPHAEKGTGKFPGEGVSALDSLMTQGVIDAQAMAYMRGRSICNQFIIVDEAQNATVTQILSMITRVGDGSKIVILGDPDQIDHPFLDKKNNGLVYASERMMGSPLCWQVTFDESECTRSALASEAIARLTPKGAKIQ